MTQIEQQQESGKFISNLIIKIGIPVFTVWIIYVLIFAFAPAAWDVKGQIGDTFGGLNTLFSGLAFGGIIYNLIQQSIALGLQRKELALQREELQLTREELSKSAEAQSKTEQHLKLTAKLNAYKSLLDYYTNLNHKASDITMSIESSNNMNACADSMLKILEELEREAN